MARAYSPAKGSCKTGLRTCKDDSTWGECVGQIGPSFEDCNQVDDNCDGVVDEGCICSPNATQPCYAGEASTRGKGRCLDGLQKCQRGFWGACESSNLPRQEECNGEDDDCNGVIDDAEKLVAPPCEKRLGVCFGAVKRCGGAQGWLPCTTEDYQRVDLSYLAEDVEGKAHCDGKDNDCDGQIDEGCTGGCVTGSVKTCYSGPQGTQGQGICREGLQICQQGVWGDCLLQVLPTTELCNNNLDDDCNGKIDDCKAESTPESASEPLAEGGPNEPSVEVLPETPCQDGEKRPCSLGGVGVCGDGQATCSAGTWGACLPIAPRLDHEKCDGLDNNCNGLIDEAFAIRPNPPLCKDQQGACAGATLPCTSDVYEPKWSQIKSGDAICSDAHYKAHSNHVRRPAPTNGEEDRCDNFDNDCDGQVDEGCPWIKIPKNSISRSPRLVVGKDAQNRDVLYVAASIASAASNPFELDTFSLSGTTNIYRPFVAKYDASGSLVWAFAGDYIGNNVGQQEAIIRSVALDPTQRWLYVLFDYASSIRVGNQTLAASDISGGSGSGGGGRDVALLKIDAQTGALVWATNLGGPGEDQGRSVHVDAQGDIYLSVLFKSSVFFQTTHLRMIIGTNQTFVHTDPSFNVFHSGVLKLTEETRNGELQPKLLWLAQPQDTLVVRPEIVGESLVTDANNVWWIGHADYRCSSCPTEKVLRFGTYALSFSSTTYKRKLFLARLNTTTGAFTAVVSIEESNPVTPTIGYHVSIQNNKVTLAGTFEGEITFKTSTGTQTWKPWGKKDVLVLRLAQIQTSKHPVLGDVATPTWEWVTHLGSSVGDDLPLHLYSDAAGAVYVVGQSALGFDRFFFGPQSSTNPQSPTLQPTGFGANDGFIAKIDSTGNIVWGGLIGSNYGAGSDALVSVASHPSGNFLYVAGETSIGSIQIGSRNARSPVASPQDPSLFLWQIAPCALGVSASLNCYPK